jgi:hypothetical protein
MDPREVAEALPAFRAAIDRLARRIARRGGAWLRPVPLSAPFAAASRAGSSNIHATGYGLRLRSGRLTDQVVLKVYVIRKVPARLLSPPARILSSFRGIPVDVEELPVSIALPPPPAAARPKVPPNRRRVRPIVPGVSIAPLGQSYVGTLGCFVRKDLTRLFQSAWGANHIQVISGTVLPVVPFPHALRYPSPVRSCPLSASQPVRAIPDPGAQGSPPQASSAPSATGARAPRPFLRWGCRPNPGGPRAAVGFSPPPSWGDRRCYGSNVFL